MREETDFAALYKNLIDGHFVPERERAQAALFAVLSRLSDREPDGACSPEGSPDDSGPL